MATVSNSHLYKYKKIIELDKSPSVNFYGRIISFKPPRQTRGSDWAMNLVVIDDSFEGRADLCTQNPAGMSVMIFKPSENEFPAVKQIGDIVQFRHFKTQYYESAIQAISTKWSAFTVFHKENPSAADWNVFPERQVHEEELEVVEKISKMKIGADAVPFVPSAASEGPLMIKGSVLRPTMTVSEVRHGIYFNGNFKVMKVSDSFDGEMNQLSLIVCDYTENPYLSADPQSIGLPAYLNNSLLPLTLWDNFAEEARRLNLKAGDFVYFDNLLGRQVRHENGLCNVVAVLHGDPKVKVMENFIKVAKENKKIDSQAVRLAQLKKSMESEDQILEAVAPKIKEAPPQHAPQTIASVSEQAKIKKQQTKRTFSIKKSESSPLSSEPEAISSSKFSTTSVGGDSYAVTTILSVRSYPSDNAKFCVKARIVSLGPSNFYEMVRYVCDRCDRTTDIMRFNETKTCSYCHAVNQSQNFKFIWVFCMIIEDATGDLAIIVADEDARNFLGCAAFNLSLPENETKLKQVISIFEQLLSDNESEHLFCIKTYRVDNEDGISNMRYRLFNTKMI